MTFINVSDDYCLDEIEQKTPVLQNLCLTSFGGLTDVIVSLGFMNRRVCLIIDNTALAEALAEHLVMENYTITFFDYLNDAFEIVAKVNPAIIVTRLELLECIQDQLANAALDNSTLLQVPIVIYSSVEREIFRTSIIQEFKLEVCESDNLLEVILST